MAAATPVLLVSTATRWYGTARTPRALAKAGFEVTLLTPRNSLAESSRFVTRVAICPIRRHRSIGFMRSLHRARRFAAAGDPCDDVSFRLLAMLALSPPPQMQPRLQAELAELVRASLGDPAHFAASVDKTLIYAAAGPAGVRVPEHAVISSVDEAMRFADRHGFPLVIKRPYTTAGDGVRIVENAAALGDAVTSLSAPKMDDLEPDASRRLVVQKYIAGTICYQNVAAWQGRYLAGYAGDRLETHGGPMTPGTVVRYHDAPALREFSVQLVESLGMTGLFTSEYIVEKATGLPYLIEINRRISPGTHYGAVMNVDLCAALHAAMHGVDSPSRSRLDSGEERIFVQFPAEWLRNPQSPWLRRHPVDVPWDDPELLDAMLALRNER